mmetsp:Transcript_109037/g.351949  ORF Transcript_109037/g.351949 Transcript_109037/m.351949 type:complete len:433 (+) Transcript_109037:101-1399(+)
MASNRGLQAALASSTLSMWLALAASVAVAVAVAAALWRRRASCGGSFAEAPAQVVVKATADRGKVLVSHTAFRCGDVVFREGSALFVPSDVLPLASFFQLSAAKRRKLLDLHCPDALSPAPEDGGGQLSKLLGERREFLERVMIGFGWSVARAKVEKTEAWQFLRIWDANKLSFQGRDGREQGIFATICRMNHSCEPNVRLMPGSAPHELVAYAAVDIASGEELCICYSERNALPMLHFLHLPTEGRWHWLQRWGFTCACERCRVEDDGARAFRCPRPSAQLSGACPGHVLHRRSRGWGGAAIGALTACSVCGFIPLSQTVAQLLNAEMELRRQAEEDLPKLLRDATESSNFPMAEVEALAAGCEAAGLAGDRHWLVFWLSSLAAVGRSSAGLGAAAQGLAAASVLPGLGGGGGERRRPGATSGVQPYLAFE